MCWPYLPSELQGRCRSYRHFIQTWQHPEKKKRKFPLFHLFLLERKDILQKVPGNFLLLFVVKSGSYTLFLVIRMAGKQDSQTFSLCGGRWVLSIRKGMVIRALSRLCTKYSFVLLLVLKLSLWCVCFIKITRFFLVITPTNSFLCIDFWVSCLSCVCFLYYMIV